MNSKLNKLSSLPMGLMDTAVALIAVCAVGGLAVGGHNVIAQGIVRARVKAAVPSLLIQIRNQREVLMGAIEAYRASFGVYPPDNVVSRDPVIVDPIENPLLYELSGATYISYNQTCRPGPFRGANVSFALNYFHCAGFMNCGTLESPPKDFLLAKQPAVPINGHPPIYVLACALKPELADCYYALAVSPWRYVSSNPTNNPSRYDLWVEVQALGKKYVIGNWTNAQ
jgi:hypothetical protein